MQVDIIQDLRWWPEDKPFLLCPLGDIQWQRNLQAVALGLLLDHISACMEEGGYFIGLGDFVDVASPSNRRALATAGLYDSTEDELDHAAEELVEDLIEVVLAPTVGRWVCLVSGHHFYEFSEGGTSDTLLAKRLGCPFAGTCALVELRFRFGSVYVWVHHGANANVRNPLGKLENEVFPVWDADIYLLGHTPVVSAKVKQRVYKCPDQAELGHREGRLVTTGGWLKSYREDAERRGIKRGDYAEMRMLPPATIGAPIIRIWPRTVGGIFAPKIRVEL